MFESQTEWPTPTGAAPNIRGAVERALVYKREDAGLLACMDAIREVTIFDDYVALWVEPGGFLELLRMDDLLRSDLELSLSVEMGRPLVLKIHPKRE